MDNMEKAEILEQAADLIEVHGHTKFSLKNFEGQLCARGAILGAVEGVNFSMIWLNPVELELTAYVGSLLTDEEKARIRAHISWSEIDLVNFNNHPDTTPGEVQDLLRRGAKYLRERG